MKVSDKAIRDLFVEFEGLVLKLYNDPVGHCTIGIGHLVHHGRCNGSEPEHFKRGLTEEQAYDLLKTDLVHYSNAVTQSIKRPMTQTQFDAMVSLCFNIGTGAFASSSVCRRFNEGNIGGAADAFMMWTKAEDEETGQLVELPGLVRRRQAERRHFLSQSAAVLVEDPLDLKGRTLVKMAGDG